MKFDLLLAILTGEEVSIVSAGLRELILPICLQIERIDQESSSIS